MTANAPVKYSDLLGAFEWVNAGAPGDNSAYISRISGISGRIYWDSDAMELDEKPPEDIDDGARYLEVPHKHRLDLGNNLVFRFTEAYLPDEYAQVKGFFRRTGAYRKFIENSRIYSTGAMRSKPGMNTKTKPSRTHCANGVRITNCRLSIEGAGSAFSTRQTRRDRPAPGFKKQGVSIV